MTKSKKTNMNELQNSTPVETKIEAPVAPVNNEEYTVSPDGKYKFLKVKPKSHGVILQDDTTRIPYFERPGYQICWFTDEKPHDLDLQRRKGYEFVDRDCEEAQGRELVVHAGYRLDGSPYHHYAMQMPIEAFNAMKAAEQKNIIDHEMGQGLYATQEMQLGTKYQHALMKKE